MIVDWGAVATGLVLGVPSIWLGRLAHQRYIKGAADTKQNWFVDQLQEDNTTLRAERDAAIKDNHDLRRQLTRYQRKYGNGDNGA